MLYDRARIFVQAGAGGDGAMSFRREAHVPHGGPDGGDGGRGGDVVLVVDASRRDLQSYKRKAHYRAKRGGHGEGGLRIGASGEPLEIPVPPGTVVTTEDGRAFDLVRPGQRVTIARGGGPGRGNKHFAHATRQAPRFAEKGVVGDEGWLELRLKLLADVGLVGLPNAGKSSLLRRLTRAQPKVADYPFTTLEPALGTVRAPGGRGSVDDRQLILADIPGLIEGASEGAGLGHEFLAHVERTRLLVHVLELAPLDGSAPEDNFATIEAELGAHDPRLATLPRVLALSKADLVTPEVAEGARAAWVQQLGEDACVVVTSSATGQGLGALVGELFRRVPPAEARVAVADGHPDAEALAEHVTFRPATDRGFRVERDEDGLFRVLGRGVERLLSRYDLDNDEAMAHVEGTLIRIGVMRALEEAGFTPGDDVEIAGVVFELDAE